jgi:hypothetical protein
LKAEIRILFREVMPRIRLGQQSIPLPASRFARLALGLVLIGGGFLGFLPILGFWMIPLGLLVLSFDLPQVRRWRRRFLVRHAEDLRRRNPTLAEWLGLGRRHPQNAERTNPPTV